MGNHLPAMMTNRALPGYQRSSRPLSSALDAGQKPYYCGSRYSCQAVLPSRSCLALHRSALPLHLPPTTGKASALLQNDALLIANGNVTQNQLI